MDLDLDHPPDEDTMTIDDDHPHSPLQQDQDGDALMDAEMEGLTGEEAIMVEDEDVVVDYEPEDGGDVGEEMEAEDTPPVQEHLVSPFGVAQVQEDPFKRVDDLPSFDTTPVAQSHNLPSPRSHPLPILAQQNEAGPSSIHIESTAAKQTRVADIISSDIITGEEHAEEHIEGEEEEHYEEYDEEEAEHIEGEEGEGEEVEGEQFEGGEGEEEEEYEEGHEGGIDYEEEGHEGIEIEEGKEVEEADHAGGEAVEGEYHEGEAGEEHIQEDFEVSGEGEDTADTPLEKEGAQPIAATATAEALADTSTRQARTSGNIGRSLSSSAAAAPTELPVSTSNPTEVTPGSDEFESADNPTSGVTDIEAALPDDNDEADITIEEEGEEDMEDYPTDIHSIPAIILNLPNLGARSLFLPLQNGSKLPVWLKGKLEQLGEASLSDVWSAVRDELKKEGLTQVGEMIITEKQMELKMGEVSLTQLRYGARLMNRTM